MKRVVYILGVLGLFVTLPRYSTGETTADIAAASTSAGYVELDQAERVNAHEYRAFVATGSASNKVLATLAEADNPVGATLYAGPRTSGGRQGVLLSLFLDADVPPAAHFNITVEQEGASTYAPPTKF